MIKRLNIANYALIDSVEIEFQPGLNIITGETGAGKSIMLSALSLILGARADSKVIRNQESKSIVEATFCVKGNMELTIWAANNDIDWDETECILRREIAPNGRSRAFINDMPVTLNVLSELASKLIDIHSQHQNQLLASPTYQLSIIDCIAQNSKLLEQYRNEYQELKKADHSVKEAIKEIEQNKSDEEFIRFRLNQLTEANLIDGEQEELEAERDLQSNMTSIKQTLVDLLDILTNTDASVLPQLTDASNACEDLGEVLEGANELAQRLESARLEIQDITETLENYDSNLAADPDELEKIEERLSEIYSLENKFHVNSISELISIRNQLEEKLSSIECADFSINELKQRAKEALNKAKKTASLLSEQRYNAAHMFAENLHKVASPLGMPNLCCNIQVDSSKALTSLGQDTIDFKFAFNKNQEPQSIEGAASGGEVSRLMLSIKSIIADKLQLPSIIFDEVDTGVSGDVAIKMGSLMHQISSNIQVIAITHLPQVASKGKCHFKVYKEDDEIATHTRIKQLNNDERIREIALMISGSTTDIHAIENAKALLSKLN